MSDLDKLQDAAVATLLEYFEDGEEEDDKAKMALGSLSAVARLKATKRAGDAVQFHVVSSLASSEDELRDYIKLTLPHLTPALALAGKKK